MRLRTIERGLLEIGGALVRRKKGGYKIRHPDKSYSGKFKTREALQTHVRAVNSAARRHGISPIYPVPGALTGQYVREIQEVASI